MKLFRIIKKNLKILLRNRSSAIVILIGPLLIVLLVALAFNNVGNSYKLTIGVYSDSYGESTESFISGLNEKYSVEKFLDNTSCINSVKIGETHSCIIFPSNIILDDELQDEVILYVDQSRMNLVDALINRISEIIGINVESASKDLTATLLDSISLTKSEVEAGLLKGVNIKQSADEMMSNSDQITADLSAMDLDMISVNTDSIKSNVQSLNSKAIDIKDKAIDAINASLEFFDSLGNISGIPTATVEDLQDDIISLNSERNASYSTILENLETASNAIDEIENKLSIAKVKRSSIITNIDSLKSKLDTSKSEMSALKSSLETISSSINSIKVMDADRIVNPITTTIKPLSGTNQTSTFLFPYLIILVIMFIGIMLAGISIIIDKLSPSAFRTFASPTRNSFYILTYYLTNLIITFLQVLIIGGLAAYYLKIDLSLCIGSVLLLIFLASSFFILVGLCFGYLFKSQEGVTIASLSFSSVLLFVSNLIIPLESTPEIVQQISRYNPYVLLSETLKKVMLFNVSLSEISTELFMIAGYVIGMVVLILIVQKLNQLFYFKKIPHIKHRHIENLTPEHYFRLIDGNVLKDEEDLLKFLQTCSHADFNEFVSHENNQFIIWLKTILKRKVLAKKLKGVTEKDKMIQTLEEYVAKKRADSQKE